VDWSPEPPSSWTQISIAYETRFRDRSVLLHVSILITTLRIGISRGSSLISRFRWSRENIDLESSIDSIREFVF
jgi:hypothetical protein